MSNPLLAPLILEEMGKGVSLRQACQVHEVPIGTFFYWLDQDKELLEHYTQARARLLDVKAEELEEIGERAASAETAVEVAGLRLLSDNRKWLLSKLAPKKYGDKLDLNHSGSVKVAMTDMTDDDLANIAASGGAGTA